jgi:hypothetical protein
MNRDTPPSVSENPDFQGKNAYEAGFPFQEDPPSVPTNPEF